MSTTGAPFDLTYIDDSNGVWQIAAFMQSLANRVHAHLPQRDAATVAVVASTNGFLDITFPEVFPAFAPLVFLQVTGTGNFRAYVSATTQTGFRINVVHVAGTSTTTNVNVNWVAHPDKNV